ncbi:hypothetical protein COOONC_05406, partial [Cooperia oncophora]
MIDTSVLISKYFLIFEIFFFNIIGVFGNVQLLWATFRKEFTHSKPGMLLGMNAFYHIICLLSEATTATFLIYDYSPRKRTCYSFLALHIFMMCQQCMTFLMISLDLLIALVLPMRYTPFS